MYEASTLNMQHFTPATDSILDNLLPQRRTLGQPPGKHDEPRVKPSGPRPSDQPRRTRNFITQVKLASWNVRTMSDTANSKGQAPERRSALIAKELQRLDVDIACLSECRIPEEGEFSEGNYTILYSGRGSNQPRLEGVAIALKTHLRPSITNRKGINSTLMTMHIRLEKNCHATVISAYAPTFKRLLDEKILFYDQLFTILAAISKGDRIFLIGDFNARVRCDTTTWPDIIGPNGLGEENAQGQMLLELCTRLD